MPFGSERRDHGARTFPSAPNAGVWDQHHLAAVSLHGPAALLDVELIVRPASPPSGRGVAPAGSSAHAPAPGRAKARRAGRRLGNEEDTEALRAHRSGSGPAGMERRGPAMSVGGASGGYRVHTSERVSGSRGGFL